MRVEGGLEVREALAEQALNEPLYVAIRACRKQVQNEVLIIETKKINLKWEVHENETEPILMKLGQNSLWWLIRSQKNF